jgi:cytoskeleton protein RodZ
LVRVGKFGDKLRRERELRAVTLDEIAEATKIGTRSLKALEDEQFDILPGGIFNKGFVRAYAKYLGIDEDQAVADYTAALGEATGKFSSSVPDDAVVASIAKKRIDDKPIGVDNGGTSKTWIALAVLALIGFGGYSSWNYYQQRKALKLAEQLARQQMMQAPPVAATPAVTPETLPQNPPTTTEPAAATATAKDATQKDPTATAPVAATPAGPEFTVTLHAKEDAWVSIQADGKTVMEYTLTAASDRTIKAKDKIVMKVGKPSALEVSFNGVPVGPLGPPDKTATKTFTSDGMQQ